MRFFRINFGRNSCGQKPTRKTSTGKQRFFEQLEPRVMLDAAPVITEFMASNNSTVQDADGHYSDWVEIYNAGTEAVDLAN